MNKKPSFLMNFLMNVSYTLTVSLTVKPAVSWVLALLKESLKHHDWAGFTKYTLPFGTALGYVFGKQSGSPCYCNLLLHFTFRQNTEIGTTYTEDTWLNCRFP